MIFLRRNLCLNNVAYISLDLIVSFWKSIKFSFSNWTFISASLKMPKSKVEIEAEREYITERITHFQLLLSDKKKRNNDNDKSTLNWMLRHNIRKLIQLPLPDLSIVLQVHLDMCQKFHTSLQNELGEELADRLLQHLERLEHKLTTVNSSNQ